MRVNSVVFHKILLSGALRPLTRILQIVVICIWKQEAIEILMFFDALFALNI